jgi:hypothetical protein
MRGGLLIILIAVSIGFGIWWKVYAYHDCLNVGHAKVYCTIDALGK